MQQLFFFIQKYKFFLYFLLLQIFAFSLTINNLSFHKSKFISSTNLITGSLYSKASSLSEYLSLKTQNKFLAQENALLKNELNKLENFIDVKNTVTKDSINYHQQYSYIEAKIISNSFTKPYNFLTINKGEKFEIKPEMAVINSKGIIGITDNTSKSFARVQSILNRNSKINAKFKNSNHFGTLQWDGKDYTIVQLNDIPRQANYNVGDTIITGGKSTIFPEGIPIGEILENNTRSSTINTINIKLFNNMSNLGHIQVIKNFYKKEIESLVDKNDE